MLSASQFIGFLRGINGYDDLFFYSDAIVLSKVGFKFVVLRSVGIQFGALGSLIAGRFEKRAEKKRIEIARQSTADQIAGRKTKNKLVRYSEIVNAQLTKGMLKAKLILNLSNGTTQKFEWPKRWNKYEESVMLLREALGTKLSIES